MEWARSTCQFRGHPFTTVHFDVQPQSESDRLRGRETAREPVDLPTFVVDTHTKVEGLTERVAELLHGESATEEDFSLLRLEDVDLPSADPEPLESALERVEGEIGAVLWRDACDFMLRFLELYRASWRGKSILELGSGCGYVGLALQADGADATLTDLPMLIPEMRINVVERGLMEVEREIDSLEKVIRQRNEEQEDEFCPHTGKLKKSAAVEEHSKLLRRLAGKMGDLRREVGSLLDGKCDGEDAETAEPAEDISSLPLKTTFCDWTKPGTVPNQDFQYVICCEVLYAGRFVWPGLRECLRRVADREQKKPDSENPQEGEGLEEERTRFREVLLAVNLRVGRKDIGDFLRVLTEEEEQENPGSAFKWEVKKIFRNKEILPMAGQEGIVDQFAEQEGETTVATLSTDDDESIKRKLRRVRAEVQTREQRAAALEGVKEEAGEAEIDAEEVTLSDDEFDPARACFAKSRKAKKEAAKASRTAKKKAGSKGKEAEGEGETGEEKASTGVASLTDFGIEIYSFRRVRKG